MNQWFSLQLLWKVQWRHPGQLLEDRGCFRVYFPDRQEVPLGYTGFGPAYDALANFSRLSGLIIGKTVDVSYLLLFWDLKGLGVPFDSDNWGDFSCLFLLLGPKKVIFHTTAQLQHLDCFFSEILLCVCSFSCQSHIIITFVYVICMHAPWETHCGQKCFVWSFFLNTSLLQGLCMHVKFICKNNWRKHILPLY